MASVMTTRRQLAPTVGQVAALAGVTFRTGNCTNSGERVLSGLVANFGSCSAVIDNAGCFGSRPLPNNGCLIRFGALDVYVATEIPWDFPEHVVVADDTPAICAARGRRIARPVSCAEVMVIITGTDAGKEAAASQANASKIAPRSETPAKPALEKPSSSD